MRIKKYVPGYPQLTVKEKREDIKSNKRGDKNKRRIRLSVSEKGASGTGAGPRPHPHPVK